jgi:hypothetical protein
MRWKPLLRSWLGMAVAMLTYVTLENRAAAHCSIGNGLYHACCQENAARDASKGDYDKSVAKYVAPTSHRYRYSSGYGRPKPPIKRMGQINVRNRNGGIR